MKDATRKFWKYAGAAAGGMVGLLGGAYAWLLLQPTGFDEAWEENRHYLLEVRTVVDEGRKERRPNAAGDEPTTHSVTRKTDRATRRQRDSDQQQRESREYTKGSMAVARDVLQQTSLGQLYTYRSTAFDMLELQESGSNEDVPYIGRFLPADQLITKFQMANYGRQLEGVPQFEPQENSVSSISSELDWAEGYIFDSSFQLPSYEEAEFHNLRSYNILFTWMQGVIAREFLTGDPEEGKRYLQRYAELAAKYHLISDGISPNMAAQEFGQFLLLLEIWGVLPTDGLNTIQETLWDARLTNEKLEAFRRAYILRTARWYKENPAMLSKRTNVWSQWMNGVVHQAAVYSFLPIYRRDIDRYAAALLKGDPEKAEKAGEKLSQTVNLMNLKGNFRHLPHPRWSSDPVPPKVRELFPYLSTPTNRQNRRVNVAIFTTAAIRYRHKHDDWPQHAGDLIPQYLPEGFLEETNQQFVFLEMPEFLYWDDLHIDFARKFLDKHGRLPKTRADIQQFSRFANDPGGPGERQTFAARPVLFRCSVSYFSWSSSFQSPEDTEPVRLQSLDPEEEKDYTILKRFAEQGPLRVRGLYYTFPLAPEKIRARFLKLLPTGNEERPK